MKGARARRVPERIHMVGIGGIGLSAIARILVAWGRRVTGSDLRASDITRELEGLGVRTYVGHRAEQIGDAEWVVVSSAVPETNPELRAARARGVPVVKRQRLLGEMLSGSYGIAVAGTAGKTTTSAMVAVMLDALGLDPTFIVGGVVEGLLTNARAGRGRHFVIEADEYDRTFHGLRPRIAAVTNVEMDHPDCYRDLADMREAYAVFLDGVAADGRIIACIESEELMRVVAARGAGGAEVRTYGRDAAADYAVREPRGDDRGGARCEVWRGGSPWAELALRVPGVHNLLNATAALAVADALGLDAAPAARALGAFQGVQRRFEVKGEAAGIVVVDDYAHHPTKIRATLAAARQRYPGRRLWAVFQPHTYSRTEALFEEFTVCFGDADRVIIMDTYAARASERETVCAEALAGSVHHGSVEHVSGQDAVVARLLEGLEPGDVLITMGAGDGYLVGERVLAELVGRSTP